MLPIYFFFFMDSPKYHEELLQIARGLFTQGQYSFAIVVAHTACELTVEQVITNAFNNEKVKNFRNLLVSGNTSYNIAANRIKDLYIALTDDKEIGDQPFWREFTYSVDRRNDIVHRGRMFQQGDAEKSLKAVSDLITYLDRKSKGRS